jgi:predicted N-formylglutamate amidohydrolase
MSDCWAPLITCEHAGNAVPPGYLPLFAGREGLLASHRGFDLGALATAEALARATGAPLLSVALTRLLADHNRSIGHPRLFSDITKPLPRRTRLEILATCYVPHREAVIRKIAALRATGRRVLHIASHSFTPRLGDVVRHCDVGFLYDPKRAVEKAFCSRWLRELRCLDGALILRRNYPYRGVTDGLVTALRRRFGEAYVGMELEVNQRFALGSDEALASINDHLSEALLRTMGRETGCAPPGKA